MNDVRGVFELDHLSEDGFTLVAAITADNRRIAEVIVYPLDDIAQVKDDLWDVLNERDPVTSQDAA